MSNSIDMLLYCPNCATQHIDEARPDVCETCGGNKTDCLCSTGFKAWLNEPHKSHRCESCNYVWRPADVPTNGVAAIQTKGQRDLSPVPVIRKSANRELMERHAEDTRELSALQIKYACLDRVAEELYGCRAEVFNDPNVISIGFY